MSKTFAQRLNNAKNMLAGLTAHVDDLSKRGITAETITEGTALYNKAITKENERNALKARSQEATAEMEQIMTDLESFCSEAKKLVRLELPKETWPEFGFRQGEYSVQTSQTEESTESQTTTSN